MGTYELQFNSGTGELSFDSTNKLAIGIDLVCGADYNEYDCNCFAAGKTPLNITIELFDVLVKDAYVKAWANNISYTQGVWNYEFEIGGLSYTFQRQGIIHNATQYMVKITHRSGAQYVWGTGGIVDFSIDDRCFKGARNNNTYICIQAHNRRPTPWVSGGNYSIGDRCAYPGWGDDIYKCIAVRSGETTIPPDDTEGWELDNDEPGVGNHWEDYWELDNDEPGVGNHWEDYWYEGYYPFKNWKGCVPNLKLEEEDPADNVCTWYEFVNDWANRVQYSIKSATISGDLQTRGLFVGKAWGGDWYLPSEYFMSDKGQDANNCYTITSFTNDLTILDEDNVCYGGTAKVTYVSR